MEIRRFDRHEVMDMETLNSIMDLIKDVKYTDKFNGFPIENKLYGFFDGYDYSEKIMNSDVITEIEKVSPETYKELSRICEIVSNYPTANWN